MSYEDVDRVIASGLDDATLFSVLLAIAHFKNEETGMCFPALASIARAARRSPNITRSAIRRLEDLGYIATKQQPGKKRYFSLYLDRLPVREKDEEEDPIDSKPLPNPKPLSELKGEDCQICEGPPVRSERTPMSEVTPLTEVKPLSEVKGDPCQI